MSAVDGTTRTRWVPIPAYSPARPSSRPMVRRVRRTPVYFAGAPARGIWRMRVRTTSWLWGKKKRDGGGGHTEIGEAGENDTRQPVRKEGAVSGRAAGGARVKQGEGGSGTGAGVCQWLSFARAPIHVVTAGALAQSHGSWRPVASRRHPRGGAVPAQGLKTTTRPISVTPPPFSAPPHTLPSSLRRPENVRPKRTGKWRHWQ